MRIQSQIYLGWTPILSVATDSDRRVLKVVGWEGGTGTAPAINLYVGPSGYVTDIADAVDVRGAAGLNSGGYEHDQAVPQATWSITHNLGYRPSVTVVDSSDTEVIGSVKYDDVNNVTITFSGAFSGKAYMS